MELELHGVGFKARVEPSATAAAPAGELVKTYAIGVNEYGDSFHHKQPGAVDLPDPMLGGALAGGAGGGWRHRRQALRAAPAPSSSERTGGDGGGGEALQSLMMRIGYSHECRVDFPAHLRVSCPTPTQVTIWGIDKQQVGMAASRVRLIRKPDAYKGKGLRYKGEVVKLKPTKRK